MPIVRATRLRACLLLGAALLLLGGRAARAETTADLYTIGPGSYTYAYYGHSAICVSGDRAPAGVCYDFGIPVTSETWPLAWGTLRGERLFRAISVPLPELLQAFQWQDRTIQRQRLPLAPAESAALLTALEAAVAGGDRYAYHPYFDNCTTRVRDVVDGAVGGKLHGGSGQASGPTFRALSEQGYSGRLGHLTALALLLGSPSDRRPTSWEAMFLPSGLRDAVQARLGAAPELVYEKHGVTLPTSTAVGGGVLVFAGLALSLGIWLGARASAVRARRALVLVGVLLGVLALAIDAFALVSALREIARNWALLVVLPSDLALGWLLGARLARYLQARIAGIALLLALSLAGVIPQPLAALAFLTGAPLLAAYLLVARRPAPVVQPATEAARG